MTRIGWLLALTACGGVEEAPRYSEPVEPTIPAPDRSPEDTGDTGGDSAADSGGDSGDTGAPDPAVDADGDGYPPARGDCDDGDPNVHPGALEWCNGVDDDCDGEVDGPLSVDARTWYFDSDGDGYGDPASVVASCEEPAGAVSDYEDCDDADPAVNPDAPEVCDGLDQNCRNGADDEYLTGKWYGDDGTTVDVTSAIGGGTSTTPRIVGDYAGADLVLDRGTLELCAGYYYLKIVVTDAASDVRVVGRDGPDRTILTSGGVRGGASGSVVAVSDAHLAIAGVTLYGGVGSDGSLGGGVIVDENRGPQATPSLTLTNARVEGNVTEYGGGVAVLGDGWVDLQDSSLAYNEASVAGGGAWIQGAGRLTCTASALGAAGIYENSAPIAGGLYLSGVGTGTVTTTGCDWGQADRGDDNEVYDLQQNPAADHAWCFPDADDVTDVVACAVGECVGPGDGACE